jgi:ATP-dependent protease ClpP protease subunit
MPNEILLYGEIGGETLTCQSIKTELARADRTQPLVVKIDSYGGSVFDGLSIYEAFASYEGPKRAIIEPTAMSIASYIAAAFDDVSISENGYVMIHCPWGEAQGDDEEFANQAELLRKLKGSMVEAYSRKTGMNPDATLAMMQKETYMTAAEAQRFGFVDAIIPSAIRTRLPSPAAKSKSLPHMVFASLFSGGQSGDNREPTKEKAMSESQKPVAATVTEIKRKFPKAKSDFIVKCMEKEMPMEDVAAAAMEETMAENETLAMKVQAMENELAEMKAKYMVEMPEEEEMVMPMQAKAKSGVTPIAKAKSGGGISAKAKWTELIDAKVKSGLTKARAAVLVNRENPGLQSQLVAEANS